MSARPHIDLVSGDFWGRNPHEALAWMRRHQPVYRDEANGIWGLTRYDHVREAETNPALFSSAGGIRPDSDPNPMMIEMDDPAHARRRELVSKGFTPKQVRALRPVIETIVDRLLDRVENRPEFDLIKDVAAWIPLIVIGDALGMDERDHPKLLEWSDDLMRGLGASDPALVERMVGARSTAGSSSSAPSSLTAATNRVRTSSAHWCTRRSTANDSTTRSSSSRRC